MRLDAKIGVREVQLSCTAVFCTLVLDRGRGVILTEEPRVLLGLRRDKGRLLRGYVLQPLLRLLREVLHYVEIGLEVSAELWLREYWKGRFLAASLHRGLRFDETLDTLAALDFL